MCSEQEDKGEIDTVTHCSESLIDYIHIDAWGPTKTALLGGCQYFISFVDDLSRHCWVYPMRQKFEVLHLFVKWRNLMEKQTDKKIKMLQFDHVGECKDHFLRFDQNNGIGIHFTVEKHKVAKYMTVFCWKRFSICCLMHH